jgi:TRAP-type C4-dicarboxylate transport system substrate-binding protein
MLGAMRCVLAFLTLAALLCPGHLLLAQGDEAAPAHVLRLATLAPRGSVAERALRAWNRTLRERTGGALAVRVYWGGAMGDETSMIRRMRIGDLEAASLTVAGMGSLVRDTLVLQVPGVLTSTAEADRVREGYTDELRQRFRDEGWELLGWGDAGRVRMFSTSAIRRPSDLRSRRPWVRDGDPVFRAVLDEAGASGVVVGVPEVLAGLRTGMIDTVPASALVVSALQWFTSLGHVTAGSSGFVITGMVVRGEFVSGLPEAERTALLETARDSEARIGRALRRADDELFEGLIEQGLVADDVSAYEEEWRALGDGARARLRDRVVPGALIDRVMAMARGT